MTKLRKGPELYAAIKRLNWEGKTVVEAAAIIGMSRSQINHYRRLLDLPPFAFPPGKNTRKDVWTDREDALLKELIAAGISLAVAAERIRRSTSALQMRRYRLGLPCFKAAPRSQRINPVWTRNYLKRLATLRRQRRSFAACAAALGTTRSAVAGACGRYLKEHV